MKKLHIISPLLIAFVASAVLAAPPRKGDFPGYGFIPKADTGADRFLQHYPEYDGRGVIVAIFDTGVDPGAPGLQVTSDGNPKIVDLVDGSGSGDVDTATVVEAEDGTLAGLSGRQLKLDPNWNNPTGKYHLGLKRAYEIYPGGLVARLTEERLEKWEEKQRVAVAELERRLVEWDADHASPTSEQMKERDELELRLELLDAMQDEYDDPGPVFDCVVFHDGSVWRAAIDTDEDGELSDEKLMTNYRLERQYATFSEDDLLNFAVNIYDEGNLLSIVTDVGSHGTHVAGIVAAYFHDEPELNGLAPGAQLVAVKIGDNRLDSNSCATGEVRGCIAALQNKCDLINLSFGEPSADPDVGRNCEIYSEFVNKHGIIFVSSAGNEGPALSTIGYPGSSTEAILAVGAYVSPDMMEVQYSLRERLPGTHYTWSTRGPSYDGALGVNFSAPGGAISPVPNWVLQRNEQAHGTSMSSPNACGNIALLLSGLKAEGIAYSPARIRRALENTAQPIPGVDIFAQGRGMLQINRAFEHVKKFAAYKDEDLRFAVRVHSRKHRRGIYLREPYETEQPYETSVTIDPVFHDDADNRDKVDFELRITLESTARWVECAEHLMLMHGGRRLSVKVDPTRLPPSVHYAEIRGYDSACPERGPLFRLPITVIRPEWLDEDEYAWEESYTFEPEQVERRFLAVPAGATWADVCVRRIDDGEPLWIVLHAGLLVPGYRYAEHYSENYLRMDTGAEEVRSFKVVPGRTLELCLAQYWSMIGESEIEAEVIFHGVVPDRAALSIDGSAVATRMSVETPLRSERVSPKASLNTLRRSVRPSDSEMRPLDGVRDQLPEQRQIYELILTYDFEVEDSGTVTPRVAMLDILEYQESWQSLQYMIFDASQRVVERWGLAPRSLHLNEGDYVLRYHLRHDDVSQLEQLEDMALMLDYKLNAPVSLDFYSDPDDVLSGYGDFGARTLPKGGRAVLWIAGPAADDLPDQAEPGDLLLGTMTFGGGAKNLLGAGKRPGGYRVTYVVPPPPIAEEDEPAADEDDEDEQTEEEKLAEALRDFKVGQLAKLRDEEQRALFDRLAAEALHDYPNHLPVLVEQLKRADGKQREDDLAAVVAAADRVLAQIDQEQLAAHYGVKLDPDDKDGAKVRQEMDKRKKWLVDALHRKARALFDMGAESEPEGRPETDAEASRMDAFEAAFTELQKWVDTTDDDYLMLHIDREIRHGRLGAALELLNEKIDDSEPDKELYEQRLRLLEELGWTPWKEYEEKWLLIRFPEEYPPL
ncbi:MAG: S8 family serine peptidase [Phycisphaerae bacterium]|nr:S8 family serine peptidase [Phycisphaerae bacterium]